MHVDLSTIFLSPALVGTPSVAIPVPLPPNPVLAGLAIFGQTVIVDLPSNPAGIITSNGVRSVLNSF